MDDYWNDSVVVLAASYSLLLLRHHTKIRPQRLCWFVLSPSIHPLTVLANSNSRWDSLCPGSSLTAWEMTCFQKYKRRQSCCCCSWRIVHPVRHHHHDRHSWTENRYTTLFRLLKPSLVKCYCSSLTNKEPLRCTSHGRWWPVNVWAWYITRIISKANVIVMAVHDDYYDPKLISQIT